MTNSGELRPALYAAPASLLAVTALLVGSRTWTRLTLTGVRADDGLCSLVMASTSFGLGRKASEVSAEHYAIYLKLMTVCSICFSFGCALAKCSFAVLYLRLIPNRYVQILNKCLIFYMFCQAIEETLINVFQCQPVAKAWDPKIKGSCINIEIMWWVGPMPFIWGLQLISVSKKIGLSFVLSLGLLLCILSVKRLVEATKTTINDGMLLFAEPLLWSMSELSALVVCSCLPKLRQTIHRIPWLNRLLMPGCKLSSDRADRYSKSSFGASRFFFNRRVRYGRSTSCSGDGGITEVGTCPSQTNAEDKSSSSKHHHKRPTATMTEAAEGQPIPKWHLAPPPFWSRYGPRQPMNLQSGMQSNLETSSIRNIKNRASQSTDYVPSRSEPSELWHDLNFGNAKLHLYDERHSGMRIIAIEGQEFDQMSDLDPFKRETEGYYTGKPQHAEPFRVELIDGGGVIGQVGAVHGRNTIDLIQDLGA
ncbi:uncharacterized protein PgNI_12349 [Pyricularia grisea]|uniref:Rhodopsin domain-containing protein n=1 Tax=Pyricularia grisea TaxID=148305 RepID=A0A6P8AN00_PYRGI|nr:uncharacterized protein PgNI_12349 [Pyricularia grisea]TLD03418.1 hypothetical protein PgNI_12349 [Pyricularia grisea]